MVNIYIIRDGNYHRIRREVEMNELNEEISYLLSIGIEPQRLIISNGHDLIHRKMDIINE